VTSEDAVVALVDALADQAVPYMLSGSLASNVYGVPRATQDADVVVEFDALSVADLARRLGGDFQVDTQVSFETVTGSRRLVIRIPSASFVIELFGRTDDAHDRERFSRRRTVTALDRSLQIPSAEDVIITKLRWFRAAGRSKDFEDARNVMAVQQRNLDAGYLRRWCAELDLLALLDEIAGQP
jgi:hypothetical protein